MPTPAFFEVLKQLIRKPATNPFPARHAPRSITKFLAKGKINPPVPTPEGFRGKLEYDMAKCIGCGQCERVCPAQAIELVGDKPPKKIAYYASRCTFCGQCVDVCPVKCLRMGSEFLLADQDSYSDGLVVGDKAKVRRRRKK